VGGIGIEKSAALVPRTLIASWDATGPCGRNCAREVPPRSVPGRPPLYRHENLDHPLGDEQHGQQEGEGQQDMEGHAHPGPPEFPIVRALFLAMPRTSAAATAIPVAAEAEILEYQSDHLRKNGKECSLPRNSASLVLLTKLAAVLKRQVGSIPGSAGDSAGG